MFRSHEEEYKPYRWLCDDIGMLLQHIHAKDEWNSRGTFSALLELTERAEKLGMWIKLTALALAHVLPSNLCSAATSIGPRISRGVRYVVSGQIRNTLRNPRIEGPRKQALILFGDRPQIKRTFQKNYGVRCIS